MGGVLIPRGFAQCGETAAEQPSIHRPVIDAAIRRDSPGKLLVQPEKEPGGTVMSEERQSARSSLSSSA